MERPISFLSLCVAVFLLLGCAFDVPRDQWRERNRPVSYYLYDEIAVDVPASAAFSFLTNRIPDIYTAMAKGHISYEVVGGTPIRIGSEVNCHEVAGPQEVFNHYIVADLIEGRMIHFVSDGSRILYTDPNGEVHENKSNTNVYYDFSLLAADQTRISLSIVITLPNRWIKTLGSVFGSKRLWQSHLTEELENLGRIMEECVGSP